LIADAMHTMLSLRIPEDFSFSLSLSLSLSPPPHTFPPAPRLLALSRADNITLAFRQNLRLQLWIFCIELAEQPEQVNLVSLQAYILARIVTLLPQFMKQKN